MKESVVMKKIAVVSLGIMLLLVLGIVYAGGLAISPVKIYGAGTRGETYEKTITLQSSFTDDVDILFTASGACGDWASFYSKEEPDNQIESLVIPANSGLSVLVKFSVPEDAPSGNYTCSIHAQQNPEGEGVSFVIRLTSVVNFLVSGEQVLSGSVNSMEITNVEENRPLRIVINFQNTGNVVATPSIEMVITKDGRLVDSFIYDEASIKPGAREAIEIIRDTTGWAVGTYEAAPKVYLNNELIFERDRLEFNVFERGTLRASGEVAGSSSPGVISKDEVGKIEIEFKNTGEMDVLAKIVAEVYLDGKLIDTIEGEETLVRAGETETLIAYFNQDKTGSYMVKSSVVYEGKKEDVGDFSINVSETAETETTDTTATGDSTTGLATGSATDALIGIIIVVVVVIIIYSAYKAKGGKPKRAAKAKRTKKKKK